MLVGCSVLLVELRPIVLLTLMKPQESGEVCRDLHPCESCYPVCRYLAVLYHKLLIVLTRLPWPELDMQGYTLAFCSRVAATSHEPCRDVKSGRRGQLQRTEPCRCSMERHRLAGCYRDRAARRIVGRQCGRATGRGAGADARRRGRVCAGRRFRRQRLQRIRRRTRACRLRCGAGGAGVDDMHRQLRRCMATRMDRRRDCRHDEWSRRSAALQLRGGGCCRNAYFCAGRGLGPGDRGRVRCGPFRGAGRGRTDGGGRRP
jgi:hypothetical protein